MSVAEIDAWSKLLLKNVLGRLLPFHRTTDDGTKPEPLTERTNPLPPNIAFAGERPEMAGSGFGLMVKVNTLEEPPPGGGLNTVTCAGPGEAMSEARIVAVTVLKFTKVVCRLLPFHRTTDEGMKAEPETVRLKPRPPNKTFVGEILETKGAGFTPVTVRATDWLFPPPLSVTVSRAFSLVNRVGITCT
jgi:hypothetical protein